MYVRRRIGRRRSFYQKYRGLIFILVCACTCLFTFALAKLLRGPSVTARFRAPIPAHAPQNTPQFQFSNYERLVYPYSVIPGGVRGSEELALNMEKDPVVAAHYTGFKVGQARIMKAEEAQFVHVSYRIGNRVYWTKKAVKIPKGETLITDGKESARTRCGNKVSVLPQDPVSAEEPPIETFDAPVVAAAAPPVLDMSRLPELGLEFQPNVPLTPFFPMRPPEILPYYYRPLFVVTPPQDVVVPEPGTLGLLATGLVAILGIRFARKK